MDAEVRVRHKARCPDRGSDSGKLEAGSWMESLGTMHHAEHLVLSSNAMALQGAFYASQTASAAYSIYSQYQQLQNCLQNVDSTDISKPNKKKIEFLVDQVHLLTVLRDGCTSAIGLQPSPELPPEQQKLLRDKDRPRCTSAVSACVRLQYHMHTKPCAQCAVRLSLPFVEQDSWMYDL